jgi:epoxyqueuosine reductase
MMNDDVMLNELFSLLRSRGADLIGVADLHEIEPDVRQGLPFGISIAVALDPGIISGITDGPNLSYFNEYKRANSLLDSIGRDAAEYLRARGFAARHFAATNADINWGALSTILPHKTAATRAGLGWIGKCALLVTPGFGSAVRLSTVLTDADLPAGEPINASLCGDCSECVKACPGHAVTGNHWSAGVSRDSIYDAFACLETTRKFRKTIQGIDDNICGVCIAVCPRTRRYIENH